MSQDEFALFDEWYQFTINGGDREFDLQVQDDSGNLYWLIVKGIAEYSAECIDGYSWMVKWRVRSIKPPYYVPVDNPLRGYSNISFHAYGRMDPTVPIFGRGRLGVVSGNGWLDVPGMQGSAYARILKGNGALYPRPFWGVAIVGVTAVGRLIDLGDPQLILDFSADAYTPPLGSDVLLKFSADEYMPAGTDLYDCIDEAVAADADYIYTTTTASKCKVKLAGVIDPGTSTGHVLTVRASSQADHSVVVRLVQGSTTVAETTHVALTSSFENYTLTLSGAEADSITDYTDLYAELEAA